MKQLILIAAILMTSMSFSQKPAVDVIRFDTSATTPLAPSSGWLYMDDSFGLNVYNGTVWNPIGGTSGINITDGTITLNGVTGLTFTGANISGTSPNGNVTISGGGGSGTGLEKITEGANSGWVAVGEPRANHGDIGINAWDFTINGSASTTYGATALNAVAFGGNNVASGIQSFVLGFANDATGFSSFVTGNDNFASGEYATIFGADNDASGDYSMAIGETVNAASYAEVSIGSYPIQYTAASSTSLISTDRLFNAANGTSSTPSNAFTIFKNGSMVLYPVSKATITNAQSGMIIFDSDEANKMKYYDGTNWREITTTVD